MAKQTLFHAGFSSLNYYRTMNAALKTLNGGYRMLHYPLHINDGDDFIKGQENLVDYCISKLPELNGKKVLDIGCGNGIQTIYMKEKFNPGHITGIDLNHENIDIGRSEKQRLGLSGIDFKVDDAHKLELIEDNSIDYILNIESAFHYPLKQKFIEQVSRVLKPSGQFIIADILTTSNNSMATKSWKKKMHFNHWPEELYLNSFKEVGIQLDNKEDITNKVIQGFEDAKGFKIGKHIKPIQRSMLKIFFNINVNLNTRLLKKKRQYMIFVGSKN